MIPPGAIACLFVPSSDFSLPVYSKAMIIRTLPFCLLLILMLGTSFSNSGCSRENDTEEDTVYVDPLPFPPLAEDNTGSRTRAITYVYDRRAVDATYPPKIDSGVLLFAYNTAGKIDRIRLTQPGFYVYDFSFERNSGNKLLAIHCSEWAIQPNPKITKSDLLFEFNAAGNVSLLKASYPGDPLHDVDSFILKLTGTRIDTVIDRTFSTATNTEKYAFTYNGAGDITRMDKILTTGIFTVFEQIYQYTISASPAAFTAGEEAIYWYFFARHVNVSGVTDYPIPAILFHSAKQPAKLVLQVSGFYTGTYNYQTDYYSTGRPKKMTANVITETGAFYAREAYYYSYAQ